MLAIRCTTVGRLEDLELEQVAAPPLYPGCVRIAVEACGLNYVDALFVEGSYQIKPEPPFTPGSEVAGTIIEVASDVESHKLGDRVLASPGLGGFAEQVVIAARAVATIPDSMSAGAAATLTQSFSTALFALRDRARLQPGERVLVLGGGGGVGHAAIQVARALGAEVVATASTKEKAAHATAAGAGLILNADPAMLRQEIKSQIPEGFDIVVDPIGDAWSEPALRSLREFGRLLVIGFAGGEIPRIASNLVLLRNRAVIGVDWGSWSIQNPVSQVELLAEVLALAEAGTIAPPEPVLYPLADATTALIDLRSRRVVGKAALSTAP